MTILVSAIVSTFNASEMLPGCLKDLERQTISEQMEIIVVDSGSLQNERTIVSEFQERYNNIRYLRTKCRETVYRAWNRGIRMARGRYITNANTDDRHRPDAFERMAALLERHNEISLVYADLIKTKIKNETFEKCTPCGRFRWHDWDRNLLLTNGCFIGPQPMWRRCVHELYGYFEEDFVTSGDYEFWLRISQTLEFYHLRETLGLYLEHPDSIEHRNRNQQTIENHRILSRYDKAAREGKIVSYRPLEKIQILLLNDLRFPQKKVQEAFNSFETRSRLINDEFFRQSPSNFRDRKKYFELKAKILEGNRSKTKIQQLTLAGSKLLLIQTKWFQSYSKQSKNSFSKICAFDAKEPNKPYVDRTDGSINQKMFELHNHIMLESRRENTVPGLRPFEDTAKNQADETALNSQLAACYRANPERAEDALNFYIDILKTHPDDIDTLISIGKLCRSLGRKDDAQVFFDRVVEIESGNPDARCQLPQCRDSQTPAVE